MSNKFIFLYFCGKIYELDIYNHYMHEKNGSYEDLLDLTLNVEFDEFLNDVAVIIGLEKEIEKIPIPAIEKAKNERILRAEIKINELIGEIKKLKERI